MVLSMTGCAVLTETTSLFSGRALKLPIPPCPPIDVVLEYGWIGPFPHTLSNGESGMFYAMIQDDKAKYIRYLNAWIDCAERRGIVIEEVNR